MLEILIAIVLGCVIGFFTGITPGIHINLVSSLVTAFSIFLLSFVSPIFLVVMLISMAITHTFLDIIPSTLLGLPNEDNVMTALPAHKMTLEGKAKEAIFVSSFGAIMGLFGIIIITPLLLKLIPNVYFYLQSYLVLIILAFCIFPIFKSRSKLNAIFVFLMSGALGIVVLNLKTLNQPLLPLLSGLFGFSSLLLSINYKTSIPKQFSSKEIILKELKPIKNILFGISSSLTTSFFPGLTSSHSAMLSFLFSKEQNHREYLFVNGILGTSSMFISIIALYSIEKARNGVIVAASNLIQFDIKVLWFIVGSALIASFIAICFLFFTIDRVISFISKVSYKSICLAILIFIVILVFFVSGWVGFIVLFASSCIGVLSDLLKIERVNLMGILILPIIFFFIL